MAYVFNASVFVAEEFDGDFILLNSLTGKYYELADKAALLLQDILRGVDPADIVAELRARDAETVDDTLFFINTLRYEDVLVETQTSTPEQIDGPTLDALASPQGSFVFEGFDDIAPLLLADPVHDVDLTTGQIASLGSSAAG